MPDPRIEPWNDPIAGGCWFEDALVISTCLQLLEAKIIYRIIFMADPRIEPWSDSIAGGCWFEDALVISTCLELYRGRNYYQIIWEPRENLDSGQPLVSIQKMLNKTNALINFGTQILQNQNYFYSDFTWFELYYSNEYKRLKFFQSVLCSSVAKTWIQLLLCF